MVHAINILLNYLLAARILTAVSVIQMDVLPAEMDILQILKEDVGNAQLTVSIVFLV